MPDGSPEMRLVVELIDAGHGRALQSWEFRDKPAIAIGRLADQDIPIADVYVSRQHARLEREGEGWRIVSLGQHGVIVDGALVATASLRNGQIFRLGANGPMLKIVDPASAPGVEAGLDRGSTMVSGVVSILALDDLDTRECREKVGEIVDTDFFRAIQAQAGRLRNSR